MKVFLTSAYTSEKDTRARLRCIYDEIARLGYTHLFDENIRLSYEEFAEKFKDSEKEYANHSLRFIKNIQIADICVFEVSIHSIGIGFSIEKSLEMNKPTVVIYLKGHRPIFLSGVADEKLIIREYTEKNYKKIIAEALDIARERRDKRFNFFISPKLLEYLENASAAEGVTKSKFIRNLIVNKMRAQSQDS
ncbi:MAG: hypothetical protein N2691_05880 [Patescibacteria group bacterium]|nr:hypothetical protein [Patescibacteria group bacterium]